MLPLFVGPRSFLPISRVEPLGVARLQGGFRLAWEACFDVRVKTRVVQICQVQRQVHPADVFDGGLFVILGWTEQKCFKHGSLHVILGGPKDDKQLGSESQHSLN